MIVAAFASCVHAAPYTPQSDAEVVERLPLRAADPRARELAALRERWRREPAHPAYAVELGQRYFDEAAAEGDPRWIGYAQAAIAPWWTAADPPPAVRTLRAKLLQYSHRFEPALADLRAALAAEPDNVEAWSWQTAILMVTARYAEARRSCESLAPLTTALTAAACRAQVDAATGRAGPAAAALRAALAAEPGASAPERVWAWTRLAETEERLGRWPEAEAAFKAGLEAMREQGRADVYLLAAYADFLLDRGRAAEVIPLLAERQRADALLLRLALAAPALGPAKAADAAAWKRELQSRFEAARRRGDATHEKEESRFALALAGDAPRALALARENFAVQKEPADARVLLEAALAARDKAAAEPALRWMAESGIESVALRGLAGGLEALR